MTKRKADKVLNATFLNDSNCKNYTTTENIANDHVRCNHPNCHHRKLSQKIDEFLKCKDAPWVYKSIKYIDKLLERKTDREFVKAIFAVKDDNGMNLLDRATTEKLTSLQGVFHKHGAMTSKSGSHELSQQEGSQIQSNKKQRFTGDSNKNYSEENNYKDTTNKSNIAYSLKVTSTIVIDLTEDKKTDPDKRINFTDEFDINNDQQNNNWLQENIDDNHFQVHHTDPTTQNAVDNFLKALGEGNFD